MRKLLCFCTILMACGTTQSHATEDDEDPSFNDSAFVTIATGNKQALSQAPASATVITAADIRAMGATDLDQVMETVPGVHVSYSAILNIPIYSIRGIHTQFNPQVLMLINGKPITTLFQGNRGLTNPGVALHDVERIEVIRGSGSALYGADAFAGVINIITKSAATPNNTGFGVGAGSFHTRDTWLLQGGQWHNWQVLGYLRAGVTDGSREIITSDAASGLDQLFGTRTSNAPGPGNNRYRALDASLDIQQMQWHWRTSFVRRTDVGTGAGVALALDPAGQASYDRLTSDLEYQSKSLVPDWDMSFRANFFRIREASFLTLFPANSFGGAFPQGVLAGPGRRERHLGLSSSGVYTGWNQHRVRLELGFENYALYQTEEPKNFEFRFFPGSGYQLVPLGTIIQPGSDKIYLTPQSRHLSYVMAQDEWNLAADWTLTGGIRRDQYSDFGTTINPRLALVWKADYNLSTRLLYGRAFRAPSFAEQYNTNNPSANGNPHVRPEKITSLEAGLNWQIQPTLQMGLTLFRYQARDVLRYEPNADPTASLTAQNVGSQRGHGLELEGQWQPHRTLSLTGNIAWQRATDGSTGQNAGLAPTHHVFLRSNWQIGRDFALDTRLNRVAGRYREPGDHRPPVPNYQTLDLTLRHGNDYSKWNATFSVRNVLNADVREPSLSPGTIPFDLPQPRRNLYLQLDYHL